MTCCTICRSPRCAARRAAGSWRTGACPPCRAPAWVVLSACETGLGQLSRGDELVGLQRAFLDAGTPAVVTTLWKVDDRASFVLMRRFYDALASNGPAEALRRAQRASLAEEPHPFYWAAFGLAGDPR